MSAWRIIDLTRVSAVIEASTGAIDVQIGTTSKPVPLADVAMILMGVETSISASALAAIAKYGATILVCD
jgi:CRISPR/Cas system-associated endonuclease Cas1